jgi:hypothetical protein
MTVNLVQEQTNVPREEKQLQNRLMLFMTIVTLQLSSKSLCGFLSSNVE